MSRVLLRARCLSCNRKNNSNENLWPQETYPFMGKTDNEYTDQLYLVSNMVASAKEKNKAWECQGLQLK